MYTTSTSTNTSKYGDVSGSPSMLMEKKQMHDAKAQELGTRLGAFAAMLKEKEMAGGSAGNVKTAPDTLVRQLAEAEGRLNVTSKLADFLQNSLSQAEEEKRAADARAQSLRFEIDSLKSQIKDQEDKIALREAKIKDMAAKHEDLIKQMRAAEAHLNKSYNETLESHLISMEQAEDEKNQLEGTIADLEFRLMEANRVLKFLQVSTEKLTQDKKNTEAEADRKIMELEFHLSNANRVAKFAQNSANKVKEEKERSEMEAAREIADLKFRLTETERMMKFLQNRLEQATKQKDRNEAEADGKIADLKNQLTQASQMVKFLENRLHQVQTKSDAKIADLDFKFTESSRMNKFLQTKVEETQKKAANDVANLEFKLTESQRMSKFMETKLSGAAKEKEKIEMKMQDLEVELYALKCKLDDKDVELANRDREALVQAARMEEMANYVRDMEVKLAVSTRVQEYLQSMLATAEEERFLNQMQ